MKNALNLLILLLAACVSCGGPDSTVQGTVTIDGQLAPRGTVIFHPVAGGPTAYGSISKNGTYSLRVGQGDLSDPNAGGVQSGDYIVTVVVNMPSHAEEKVEETGPPLPGARLTAEKYANKDTSDLRATVKAGANVVPLELEGAVEDEVEADTDGSESPTDAAPADESGPDPLAGESSTPRSSESTTITPADGTQPENVEPAASTVEQPQ